jgi:hypothetical protein
MPQDTNCKSQEAQLQSQSKLVPVPSLYASSMPLWLFAELEVRPADRLVIVLYAVSIIEEGISVYTTCQHNYANEVAGHQTVKQLGLPLMPIAFSLRKIFAAYPSVAASFSGRTGYGQSSAIRVHSRPTNAWLPRAQAVLLNRTSVQRLAWLQSGQHVSPKSGMDA